MYVEKAGLPPDFQNLEFHHAQALRRSTFGIPRIIGCAEGFGRHIAKARDLLADHGIEEAHLCGRRTGAVRPTTRSRPDRPGRV